MPKSPNQKLKLLWLAKILTERTDEEHPMTLAEITDALAACGISAERKSLYDDMEALRTFGLDVISTKGRRTGYYIGARKFELPELKLLVDSVQSSRFITRQKTLALIEKIEGLASIHQARGLARQVYVRNRVKSMNESVYYNVDEISGAILDNRRITFRYFSRNAKRERVFRREGALYKLSPFALIWDDENYYMLAYDSDTARFKHFRVDKMADICTADEPREGQEAFGKLDMSLYTTKTFGMFTGEERRVRIRFAAHLAGAIIDRFGEDCTLIPRPDGDFDAALDVVVSPQFFAWVFGFGREAEILSPANVRESFAAYLVGIGALYLP
ncbi:MAG: WYL domain-containing protein [Clostridia bacterium]|nr:WYL domain-containing protein [Clostridia bacterium]